MNEETGAREQAGAARRETRLQPRFGAFVTIAAALLLLFGAISRVGRPMDSFPLFGIDGQAEKKLRLEEERQRASQTIGGNSAFGLPLPPRDQAADDEFLPPERTSLEILYRSAGDDSGQPPEAEDGSFSLPPALPGRGEADEPPASAERFHIVKTGDTWFKIARDTMGDGKLWQELRAANPDAVRRGLTVGMELTVPPARR